MGNIVQNKAEIVFEKLSQLDATAKGAKKIYNLLSKRMLKSYAKHGNKAFEGFRGFINTEIIGGLRQLAAGPQSKSQRAFKNMLKDTKSNMKNFFKK